MDVLKTLLCSIAVGCAIGQQFGGPLGGSQRAFPGRAQFSSGVGMSPHQRRVNFLHGNLQLGGIAGRRSPSRLVARGRMGGRSFGRDTAMMGIRRVIGSTIHGRQLRPGDLGLPRHGGAGAGPGSANGLMRGWDGNPMNLGNIQDPWTDPLGGQPLPARFGGDWSRLGLIPGFGAGGIGRRGMGGMFCKTMQITAGNIIRNSLDE